MFGDEAAAASNIQEQTILLWQLWGENYVLVGGSGSHLAASVSDYSRYAIWQQQQISEWHYLQFITAFPLLCSMQIDEFVIAVCTWYEWM